MAVTPPAGWAKDGNTYLRANFQPVSGKNWVQYSVDPVTGNRIVYQIGPQLSTGLTNQVTGQSFDIGGTRREIMSIDSSGKVTPLKYYNDAVKNYGADGINKIKQSSKDSATQLMSKTGTASDTTKNSKEYKSGLANAAKGADDPEKQLTSQLSKEQPGTRNSFKGAGGTSPLKYPLNLKSEYQDVIKFNMLKYEPRKLNEGGEGNLGSFSQRSDFTKRTIGCVVLPIPAGISDQNAVTWNGGEMTSAQKALADLAGAGITKGAAAAADTAERQAEQVQKSASEIQTGLAAYFTEKAVGISNILSRTQGAVQNPNMELLFQAPTLRPFNFTFKLSARNDKEAQTIRSIIRFFKQGMSPIRTQSQLFLKAPHTFQLQYLHKNKDHPYLNKFKECALQSFSVDYTPEGTYATYEDGAMVSYQITMQFQELEPVFNDDYGNANNAYPDPNIGY